MLSPVECMLKAENYAAAARLDPDNHHLATYLRMAALWRARAVHLRTGGRIEQVGEPVEPFDEESLWH